MAVGRDDVINQYGTDEQKRRYNAITDENAKNELSGAFTRGVFNSYGNQDLFNTNLSKYEGDQNTANYQNQEKDLNNKQIQQAQDFRANMPQMEQDLGSAYERQARRGLAQNIQGINANASRRGLLYSGLRQGAEAGAQAKAAGDVAQKRYEINQGLEQNAQGLESGSASNIFSSYKNDIQNADDSYNLALQQMQSRNNLLTGLFGGIGAAAGGYLGRR